MRFLASLCILFVACVGVDSIHVNHRVKQVLDAQDAVSSKTETKTDADATATVTFVEPPALTAITKDTNYPADTKPALFAGGIVTGNAGNGVAAAEGVAYSAWTAMMANFPTSTDGTAPTVCPQSPANYNLLSTCAAAGVPTSMGIYNWGVGNPTFTGGAWRCAGGVVTAVYIGRSEGSMRSRCQAYNPDNHAWVAINAGKGKPGDHQALNFQPQINGCKCLYYRWRDYGAVVSPYLVCSTPPPTARRDEVRKWKLMWADQAFVDREEYRLIRAQGGFGHGEAAWNREDGTNRAPATC